jgi:hypothetical protein
MKPTRYSDRRGLTAIDGANALIAIVVLVQMWLLWAAVEAALAGSGGATLPAVIASGALTAACVGLYRFVSRIDRQMRG